MSDPLLRVDARGPRLGASQRTRGVARCEGCALTPGLCLCGELPQLAVRTRVVLVMHHVELRKTTNTGRLVARMLSGAEVLIRGERDAEGTPRAPLPPGRRLLLYPAEGARVLDRDWLRDEEPAVLLVPDGNWTQARRAARRDVDLRDAEPVSLPEGESTRYTLRRHPRAGGLSTLEAVARALGVLEGPEVEGALLDVFDRFVARSLAIRASGKGGQRHELGPVTPPGVSPSSPRND